MTAISLANMQLEQKNYSGFPKLQVASSILAAVARYSILDLIQTYSYIVSFICISTGQSGVTLRDNYGKNQKRGRIVWGNLAWKSRLNCYISMSA